MDRTPASLLERMTGSPDPAAWERFVRLFIPLLVRWARRLAPAADSDDLVQDVFVVLVRRLPEFRYDPSRSFRAWLWTVFQHTAATRKRRPWVPSPADHLDLIPAPPARIRSKRTTAATSSGARHPPGRLPGADVEDVLGGAVAGRSGVEVAREFGTTPNAVYLARVRVLIRLRHELAGLDQ